MGTFLLLSSSGPPPPTPTTFLKSTQRQFSVTLRASSEEPIVRLTLRLFCLVPRLPDNSWPVLKYSLPFQYASTSQKFFGLRRIINMRDPQQTIRNRAKDPLNFHQTQ